MPNEVASDGFVFVCTICGKMSKDKYGDLAISTGWDASCMIHAELWQEDRLEIKEGRVVRIKPIDE
jgi:hypothetical protein